MAPGQGCLPIHHPSRRPRAAEGQVTGTVHSVVCLGRGWHVSDPLALRAEASSSSTRDQGPGLFSAEPLWRGQLPTATPLRISDGQTHPSSTPSANIPHAPPEPQRFHLDSSSLAIKPERGQRQNSHYHCSSSNKQLIETYCYYKPILRAAIKLRLMRISAPGSPATTQRFPLARAEGSDIGGNKRFLHSPSRDSSHAGDFFPGGSQCGRAAG